MFTSLGGGLRPESFNGRGWRIPDQTNLHSTGKQQNACLYYCHSIQVRNKVAILNLLIIHDPVFAVISPS